VAPASAPSDQAKALGFYGKKLAIDAVTALPTGTLDINIIAIAQAPGNSLTHEHVAGFVYVVDGTHILAIQHGPTQKLYADEAGFVGAHVVHTHTNPGTTTSHWYFISIQPNTARTAQPTFPNQKVLYATPDLPALASGPYCEALREAAVQPGGRGAAHMHSGIEVVFVLAGSLQLRTTGQSPVVLNQGQGAYILPNTPLQYSNVSADTSNGGVARSLALVVWPLQQPFETDLSQAP
jgi:quercetin dioxygenase-like cupin family protein